MHTSSRALLIAGAAALALALGAGPAQAADPVDSARISIELAPVVTVQAGGAGAVVTFDTRCDVGADFTYAAIRITQNVSGELIAGETFTDIACTGEVERLRAGIVAYDPSTGGASAPFRPGTAFVTATIEQCAFECVSDATTRTLRVRERAVNRPHYESATLTLDLPDRGRVAAEGAGAVVVVQYTCAAGVEGYFNATLAQLGSTGAVSSASDGVSLRCTAQHRSGVLTFHATAAAWEGGQAFFALGGSACSGTECWYPLNFQTLKLA